MAIGLSRIKSAYPSRIKRYVTHYIWVTDEHGNIYTEKVRHMSVTGYRVMVVAK